MKPNISALKHVSPSGLEAFQTLPCCYGTKLIPKAPCLESMALCSVTLPPHTETATSPEEIAHYHEHMTELYCFLEGSGSMLLNGTWVPVQGGSVVAVPPTTYHTVRSGAHGLTMLVWTNPAYQPTDSFDLMAPLEEGFAPYDPTWLRSPSPDLERSDLQIHTLYQTSDIYLGLARLSPEASIVRHQHDKEEEAYYILEGSAEVTLGDTTTWVAPGHFVSIPKRVRHGITAGREGVSYYLVATPPVTVPAVW
jgi:mannose-6-phosphate isomerase-like protein (cupin superfamily)